MRSFLRLRVQGVECRAGVARAASLGGELGGDRGIRSRVCRVACYWERVSQADREKWDAKHGGAERHRPPPAWLDRVTHVLPPPGKALDLASGTGRVALWLAARGCPTLAVDVSPVGLARAAERARELDLALKTQVLDLETEPPPQGPFLVIACFHYLERALFPVLAARLAPGGALLCEFHTTDNLTFHAHPGRRFLLEPTELPTLVAPLSLAHYEEGLFGDHALARCVAIKR